MSEEEARRASDGEGDDLHNEEPFDSSEEEEEDDEEEIQKLREGFIVDDEDEDDVTGNTREKKNKKKKHHKRRHAKADEDEGVLDEDDLDLLMENSGAAVKTKDKNKFKRLKRAAVEEEPKKRNDLNDFFSDDDDEPQSDDDRDDDRATTSSTKPSAGRELIDELDDFIEDDEFSDMDEEAREEARERRKQERLRPTEISGIDSEKIDELYDIFGDGTDYAWALEGEDEDGEYREEESRPQLQDIYEPEELKARMLTDQDKVIRDTDIPERYQMIRKTIKNYDLDDEDFDFEKAWIAHRMLTEKRNVDEDFDHESFNKVISDVLEFMCKENMDIPFIISHRRDHLLKTTIIGEGDDATTDVLNLLGDNDLWRVLQLDIEFRALLSKRNQVNELISQLNLDDHVLTETFGQARTLTDLQDIYDYIFFKYSQEMRDTGLKKSQKVTIYDKVKQNRLYELVKAVGISASEFAENVLASSKIYETTDPEIGPNDMADDIVLDEQSLYVKVSQALDVTKRFYAEQLFSDLKMRGHFRTVYTNYSRVSIVLTEQGRLKIDKNSPYADFKYAINRSHDSFYEQPDLFLRMLEAESQHLVEIKFELMGSQDFFDALFKLFSSDGQSDVANEWNSFRRDVLNIALKKLIPLVTSSIKEDIRRECERLLFFDVRSAFSKKIDQTPYRAPGKLVGETPRVFAVTPGNGRFGIDAVVASVLDESGKLMETYKFDENPRLPTDKLAEGETSFEMAFMEAIRESQPDVIVTNGFSVNTHKLYKILGNIVQDHDLRVLNTSEQVPVIFVTDEVAVRYQNSQRALEEFPDKPPLIRYTIGLARYAQSPLLEYVNLGREVLSLSIHEHQNLLTEDKLRDAVESAYVDIVNMVGVDINKCVSNSYLAASLPYVSGLGDRKAFGLLRAVQQHPLFSRQALITNDNIKIGATIFMNCASFLRIPQTKSRAVRHGDDIEAVTVLDDTRIHPEDYALAEKMAADALDYDEDQIEELKDAPAGETIIDKLVEMEDRGSDLLKSLVLEDYSRQLEEAYGKKKRATLEMILEELQDPFAELRANFSPMNDDQIFEALTGEKVDDYHSGAIIPVLVKKVDDYRVFALTSSRVECNGAADACRDPGESRSLRDMFHEGLTVPAKILAVDTTMMTAEIALIDHQVKSAPERVMYSRDPEIWDLEKEKSDYEVEHQKKVSQQRAIRVINHPLFHNYNAAQAQNELAAKERGAAVIRPSSLGDNHIAITWKVDNNLYQHINVVEHNKPNEYSMGAYLTIDKLQFTDLDDILINYVGEIAKRVTQMTEHEKFRPGSRETVTNWITEYAHNNPKRGVYCYAFNYRKPGTFLLLFKTGDKELNTWNVKVLPNGFELNGYTYGNVDHLSNGFKTLLKSQGQAPQPPAARASHYGGYNNSSYGQTYNGYGNNGGYGNGSYGASTGGYDRAGQHQSSWN